MDTSCGLISDCLICQYWLGKMYLLWYRRSFLMRAEALEGEWKQHNKNYSRETVCLCLVCSIALGLLEKKPLWIICSSCSACAEIKKRSGTVQRNYNVSFPWTASNHLKSNMNPIKSTKSYLTASFATAALKHVYLLWKVIWYISFSYLICLFPFVAEKHVFCHVPCSKVNLEKPAVQLQ